MNELERIALLAGIFGKPASGVGIGDDAAVLLDGESKERLVWTVDAQVDGTHFKLEWLTWKDVGWRSFMAAASDLAAMGATPVGALSALVLAPSVTDEALAELAEGQAAAAKAIGTVVVGGNLARGTETSITTTLLGRAEHPVLRSGARVGDGVWLAGKVGFAATGLAALAKGQGTDPVYAKCIDSWRRPRARFGLGVGRAGIDISDGLARDAMHVANASNVTIALESAAIPLPPRLDREPLDYVLHGGEDYALLMTSLEPLPGYIRIGSVIARPIARPIARTNDDSPSPSPAVLLDGKAVENRGFDHFLST